MEEIAAYRAKILEALRNAHDEAGNALLTEENAVSLIRELNDNELKDGMLFNTPEEVAELLIDSGLQ